MKLEPEIERALAYALAALEKVSSLKAEVARQAIEDAHDVLRKRGWEPRAGGWASDFEGEVGSERDDREKAAWDRRQEERLADLRARNAAELNELRMRAGEGP